MELEDLLIKTYRADKINGEMVIAEDPNGCYQAEMAEDVKRALTIGIRRNSPPVWVRIKIGGKWYRMKKGGGY